MTSHVVKTEELRACTSCGGRRLRPWRTSRDRLYNLSAQEFKYSKCEDCALVFLSLRPTAEEAHKFYPEHYIPYQKLDGAADPREAGANGSPAGARLGSLARRSVGRVLGAVNGGAERLLPDAVGGLVESRYRPPFEGAALLDFGCGSDLFLNWAAGRGWKTTGIDFTQSVVERVAASGHRGLLMGPGVWDEMEDESFDFVRLSHVLEHLYEPEDVLRRLCAKMKPGATLHVSVPNPMCLTSRVFGARWYSLDCPRHVHLYTPSVLGRVLERAGFEGAEFAHDFITKDFARSLGFLLHERGWLARDEIEGMMYRPALAGALHLPAKIAAALGVADRYHAFARKAAR